LVASEAARLSLASPSRDQVKGERQRLSLGVGGEAQLQSFARVLGVTEAELARIAERKAVVSGFLAANLEGTLEVSVDALQKAYAEQEHPFGDQPFEVVLNNSGKTFLIPPDKTILAVLIESGEDPMHDCQRGDCGICQVSVIEGKPDHRDYILTDTEKADGKVMQICVSRSKSPRLVLDL
jgi:ferredoxin